MLRRILLGAVLLGPATAAAQDAPPSFEPARFRLEVGGDFGQMLGMHVRPEIEAVHWNWGEFGVGGLFSVHGHFWHDPRHIPPELDYSGSHASVRVAGEFGPTFLVPGRFIGLGLHGHVGAVLLMQDMTIEDSAHDLTLEREQTTPWLEVGVTVSMRARFDDHLGLTIDLTMPVWILNAAAPPLGWLIQGPTIGVAFTGFI